jgi:hypothetical protein
MFERSDQPLISFRHFAVRLMKALLFVLAIDGAAVLLGAIGYRLFAGMDWLSACDDAVMVITGNGLVIPVKNEAGRIFSMFDAVIGVLIFITTAGMVLAPIFHRILHTFHLELRDHAR